MIKSFIQLVPGQQTVYFIVNSSFQKMAAFLNQSSIINLFRYFVWLERTDVHACNKQKNTKCLEIPDILRVLDMLSTRDINIRTNVLFGIYDPFLKF